MPRPAASLPEKRLNRLFRPADDQLTGHEVRELLVGQDDDTVGPCDGELLGGDLLARGSEDVGVLETDVGEEHDSCIDGVRRVVPAAKAGLDPPPSRLAPRSRRTRRR